MPRKRLSVRRQNQIAALPDFDLPLMDVDYLNSKVTAVQTTKSANQHVQNHPNDLNSKTTATKTSANQHIQNQVHPGSIRFKR